ncbi:adenine DNA glycosylase [Opitutia bacterium]|nr:adenine DNA glycosylase [Opitutae bacterium]
MPAAKPARNASISAMRRALLAWFARNRRPMPWREKVSAYRTVVSELMCQQTQIATVIPYFERWTAKWPDFKDLAKAEESEVLALWAGLGYYSRARNLLNLAKQVAALKAPPRTTAEWREFKGVGPYTAAAIASIAFAEPVAVVDGNVVRVLARLDGVRSKLRDASSAAKLFTTRADELVDPSSQETLIRP